MTGLVLAAGKGTRFSADGKSGICKALLEVGGKPLISYSLNNLLRLGVSKAVIVIGPQHQGIVQTLGSSYCGMELQYVVQAQPVGLANAMFCAGELIDDDVVLQLSDEIFLRPVPAETLTAALEQADFLVGYSKDCAENIRRNYSVETDNNNRILHCTEKPSKVEGDRKGTGFCVFSAACFALLKNTYDTETNRPCELCDFINALVQNGKTGLAVSVAEEEFNINTPAELESARQCVEQRGISQ